MKKNLLTPIMLAATVLLGACASGPRNTSLLDQARNDYRMAQSSPNVTVYAPLELKLAADALDQANSAANRRESDEAIDQLAYLARQKTAVAQEMSRQKAAEADLARAARERDQIQLAQRTNEVNQAKANTEKAKWDTQLALTEAADAQRRADEEKRKTDDAQRNAQDARRAADDAQRQTQAAQDRSAQLEAQLQAQLADLAAKKTERGIVITLGDVLFGTDLARLNPQGLVTAQKLADVLQQNPQRRVLIEGYADSTGATAHNQELSERRATTVRTALQTFGIASDRVAVRGYGESYPVASNDTEGNRRLNRRVEIILSDANGQTIAR